MKTALEGHLIFHIKTVVIHLRHHIFKMFLMIFTTVFSVAAAGLLQGYQAPQPFDPSSQNRHVSDCNCENHGQRSEVGDIGSGSFANLGQASLGGSFHEGEKGGAQSVQPSSGCGAGQVAGADGNCLEADVSRNIFLVDAPQLRSEEHSNHGEVPKPKLHYNIVFVRTPEDPEAVNPIVVPPPQHKTLVYVLNKDKEREDPQVIQMDTPAHKPEVFFVNYKEGDNPQLPIGVDLQTALQSVQSTLEGKVVSGGVADAQQSGFIGGGSAGAGFVQGAQQGGFIQGSGAGFVSTGDGQVGFQGNTQQPGFVQGGGAGFVSSGGGQVGFQARDENSQPQQPSSLYGSPNRG